MNRWPLTRASTPTPNPPPCRHPVLPPHATKALKWDKWTTPRDMGAPEPLHHHPMHHLWVADILPCILVLPRPRNGTNRWPYGRTWLGASTWTTWPMCHFTDILHCLLMLPRPIINRQSHNILTGFKICCIVISYIHFSLTLSCLGEARSTCITACVHTIAHTLHYLSCWSWYLIFVIACSLWFHLYIGVYSCIKGSSVLPSRPVNEARSSL